SLGCCLLLALALLGTGTVATRKCHLQGMWRNELGSNMTLSALDAAGTFSGSYHTAVAATNKKILVSPLQGAQQHPSTKRQPTFGFTVQWQFS
ncbi:AVID protein, partial [Ceuthmochares aereus]|nr:AVID protein [Ceuthmochares aereus]